MKKYFGIGIASTALVVFAATANAGATSADQTDTYTEADAGSLGVEVVDTTTTYCAADAGSLGVDDPVTVCRSAAG